MQLEADDPCIVRYMQYEAHFSPSCGSDRWREYPFCRTEKSCGTCTEPTDGKEAAQVTMSFKRHMVSIATWCHYRLLPWLLMISCILNFRQRVVVTSIRNIILWRSEAELSNQLFNMEAMFCQPQNNIFMGTSMGIFSPSAITLREKFRLQIRWQQYCLSSGRQFGNHLISNFDLC